MTISQLIDHAIQRLADSRHGQQAGLGSADFRLDVELLLSHVINQNRVFLLTWPDKPLSSEVEDVFESLLLKRFESYPIAYLTGKQEFWSLEFLVDERVLIPRPETECLIEYVLEVLGDSPSLKCLDLGTGSGAIALALASEKPGWQIEAVDRSEEALLLAKKNQSLLGLGNAELYYSDWFEQLDRKQFDVIVSNPPYIEAAAKELTESIRHEPQIALVSGEDGLSDIKTICQQAPSHLKHGGLLVIEHGYQQAEKVRALFLSHGFEKVESKTDYAGLDRFTVGTLQ